MRIANVCVMPNRCTGVNLCGNPGHAWNFFSVLHPTMSRLPLAFVLPPLQWATSVIAVGTLKTAAFQTSKRLDEVRLGLEHRRGFNGLARYEQDAGATRSLLSQYTHDCH